jgi:hypothetical protein
MVEKLPRKCNPITRGAALGRLLERLEGNCGYMNNWNLTPILSVLRWATADFCA